LYIGRKNKQNKTKNNYPSKPNTSKSGFISSLDLYEPLKEKKEKSLFRLFIYLFSYLD